MESVLDFDPNRDLGFDAGRILEFGRGRDLEFRPSRDLDFIASRDLGFGRRGVVFRGTRCSRCGAVCDRGASRCGDCGMILETGSEETPAPEDPGTAYSAAVAAAVPGVLEGSEATIPAGSRFCTYCGVPMRTGEDACWNCGSRAAGGVGITTMPAKASKPVNREWRRGVEG